MDSSNNDIENARQKNFTETMDLTPSIRNSGNSLARKSPYGGGFTLFQVFGKGYPTFLRKRKLNKLYRGKGYPKAKPRRGPLLCRQAYVDFLRTKIDQKKRSFLKKKVQAPLTRLSLTPNIRTGRIRVNQFDKKNKTSLFFLLVLSNFYPSPVAAKQALSHGLISVNGFIQKYPHRSVKIGDVIQVKSPKARLQTTNYWKNYALATQAQIHRTQKSDFSYIFPRNLKIHIDYKKLIIILLWNFNK